MNCFHASFWQLNSAPDGLSITEKEIRQFQALFPDSAQNRMFFYFRSPRLARYTFIYHLPAWINFVFVVDRDQSRNEIMENAIIQQIIFF